MVLHLHAPVTARADPTGPAGTCGVAVQFAEHGYDVVVAAEDAAIERAAAR
ncbi:hypothetical protein O7622_20870 [Micromonospora sp. WMMD1076]|uniref:hypothetical protein n=1 Tax=Micromonospora sp. WMMD1076 TaxID=3016103 RepID=UPI00249B9F1B|nr:hypothetical protein [Micromonospora sp. WMMD1076]WFF05496.1 hypothetical protein O7622_20870 [Micromonospora sp. WMMD1076]